MITSADRQKLIKRDKEMIPRTLIRAMFALALASLVLVGYSTFTDRPLVGQPLAAPVTAERLIVLQGTPDGAVTIREPEGAVLAELTEAQAGFISVVTRGLNRRRLVERKISDAPVRLIEYENGRLAINDPETGWQVELASFGAANRAAFAKLLVN
ncbi:MAG: photosynthetic complex assembly protein PuhC [Pseudomonadota bacterium]